MAHQPWLPAHLAMTGVIAILASACDAESDRPSEVHSLRVLAVRADSPFAAPGSEVELNMLAYDGSPLAQRKDGSRRKTSNLWIGGCVNPAGDNYKACLPYLDAVLGQLDSTTLENAEVPAEPPNGVIGWGDRFVATIPSDIVAARPRAAGLAHAYGVEIVFFANCGGDLRRVSANSTSFGLGCFDRETGEALGRDDFEFGFYPIYAYEALRNQNPGLEKVAFAGHAAPVACSAEGSCAKGEHCGMAGQCIPIIPRCKSAHASDCPTYPFTVEVSKTSAERAATAQVDETAAQLETLWISYYANAGSFDQDARVVHDPHSGWAADIAGRWRANVDTAREVRLWAVLRDNRNGSNWVYRDVWVQ